MSAEVWTVGRLVKWATDDFRTRGFESPRLEAELLLGSVLSLDRIKLITESMRPLGADELTTFKALLMRRRRHEPVAYLLGRREFYGRSFAVDPSVLIPRPDTEALVETALRRTEHRSLSGRALDLCTGSGCVAITFARERPTWSVTGTDLSPAALAFARRNALRLGAIWNMQWFEGDLFAPLGPARPVHDLITANPPYIPEDEVDTLEPTVRDFEPRMALAGGPDGLVIMRRLVAEAPARLAPGGVLAVEIMAGTSEAVRDLFAGAGLGDIEVTRDYGGHDRVVSGRRT